MFQLQEALFFMTEVLINLDYKNIPDLKNGNISN